MYIAAYQIHTTLNQDTQLPPYLGSLFRHSFEKAFKLVACPAQLGGKECIFGDSCPYTYIFNTDRFKAEYQEKQAQAQDANQKKRPPIDVPKPFVIEMPFHTEPYSKRKGDELIFNLILVGKAITYMPLFVLAFKEAGRMGLADGSIKFTVSSAQAVDTLKDEVSEIWSRESDTMRQISHLVTFQKVAEQFNENQTKNVQKLTLDFITPFRVKRTQMALANPEYFITVKPILRRLLVLARFYTKSRINMDYKKLMALASQVKVVDNKLTWFDWGKFSPKNESKAQIGGLYGSVTYEGPVGDFLPYLVYGQLVHAGKNTTYGLGKFAVDFQMNE